MSSWPRYILAFAVALARRWAVFMTGGFVVGLITLYQYLSGSSLTGWPLRIGISASIIAAIFMTWRDEREQVEKLTAELVDPLIPDELIKVFAGRTTIQGMKLCRIYMGRWITVSGPIENIFMKGQFPFAKTVVTFASGENKAGISMLFGRKWKEPISMLRLGDQIIVRGQVEEVDASRVMLKRCEPIDFQIQPTLALPPQSPKA